jgi:5-methylcytosine-specific restriction endonuclease McrA
VTADSECLQQGRTTEVQGKFGVTDHIVPVTGPDDPRFYDESNHQSLCNRCHNRKRQREARQAQGARASA